MSTAAPPELLRLCAALEAGAESVLEASMRDLPDPTPVEEALLQSYLFVGYQAVLNAFAFWRQLSGRPAQAATEDGWDEWPGRGAEVCRQVYGGQYGELRENVRVLRPRPGALGGHRRLR